MINAKEFYILGLPINTPIGQCNFLKIKDYPDYFLHLNAISTSKLEIIYNYQKQPDANKETIEYLKQLSLYEMIMCSNDVVKFYRELFGFLFQNPDAFDKVPPDQFDQYRQMVLDMHCVKEEKINPNPKIQAWIEKSKKFHEQMDGDKITFADIISSVVGFNGLSYEQINNMTLYQLYMTFHRIAHIKNYDTMTLFATVSTEKVDIQNWCKHIDLFVEEQHGLARDEYDKKKKEVGFATRTGK